MNEPACQLVFSNFPDRDSAARIARTLVEEGLAACVNLLPGVESYFRWQGTLQHENEITLMAKIAAHQYTAVEQRLRALHPYELPEIIAVPIAGGLSEYLDWIRASEPSA